VSIGRKTCETQCRLVYVAQRDALTLKVRLNPAISYAQEGHSSVTRISYMLLLLSRLDEPGFERRQ